MLNVLIAGLTGQLGSGFVEAGAADALELFALARDRGARPAGERTATLAGRAIPTFAGDVTRPDWGLSAAEVDALADTVDVVVNLTAETNWAAPWRRLHAVNTLGAVHGAGLADRLQQQGGRCALYCHASSLFVAGAQTGRIPEAPLPGTGSRTRYEHSKWLAEQHLLAWADASEVRLVLPRFGALVGNSATGRTLRRDSFYVLADRLDRLPWGLVPAVPNARVDVLPRDVAGDVLLRVLVAAAGGAGAGPVIVHASAGETAPTVASLLAVAGARGRTPSGFDPRALRMPSRALAWISENFDRFLDPTAATANAVTALRYLAFERTFERDRLAALLGDELPRSSVELLADLIFGESRALVTSGSSGDPALARFFG